MHLKDHYQKNVVPALKKELKEENPHALPKVEKVLVHVAIGSYLAGNKDYDAVVKNITKITGQKPIVSKSRKAISNFKLRIGMPVGVTATLRKQRMYDFLQKLVHVVLPRIRDFQGISKKSFDGHGNYNIGIKEYSVFPDISNEEVTRNHGIQIIIKTTAKDDQAGYLLMKELGFPFKRDLKSQPKESKVAQAV